MLWKDLSLVSRTCTAHDYIFALPINKKLYWLSLKTKATKPVERLKEQRERGTVSRSACHRPDFHPPSRRRWGIGVPAEGHWRRAGCRRCVGQELTNSSDEGEPAALPGMGVEATAGDGWGHPGAGERRLGDGTDLIVVVIVVNVPPFDNHHKPQSILLAIKHMSLFSCINSLGLSMSQSTENFLSLNYLRKVQLQFKKNCNWNELHFSGRKVQLMQIFWGDWDLIKSGDWELAKP